MERNSERGQSVVEMILVLIFLLALTHSATQIQKAYRENTRSHRFSPQVNR